MWRAVGSETPCWGHVGGRAASGRYSGESAARGGGYHCCCSNGRPRILPDYQSPWTESEGVDMALLDEELMHCQKEDHLKIVDGPIDSIEDVKCH